MSKPYDIRTVNSEQERQDALTVRRVVFVHEQQVPEELEIDEHDQPGADALHFVAYQNGQPVAAGRLRTYEPGTGKVERVAVVAQERSNGLGRLMMEAIEQAGRTKGYQSLYLHAQLHARAFYEKLGYEPVGDVFEEAGIPHIAMKKRLA